MDNPFVSAMQFIYGTNEVVRGEDNILCHVHEADSRNEEVIISNLVYSRRFGTGPTVHSKISGLVERKLINLVRSKNDARAKVIVLTQKGKQYLVEQNISLMKAMGMAKASA